METGARPRLRIIPKRRWGICARRTIYGRNHWSIFDHICGSSGLLDDKGWARIDYRPVHDYTLTNDVQYIPPKARTY